LLTKFILFLSAAPFFASAAEPSTVDRLNEALQKTMPRMACNLSPKTPKPIVREINGMPVRVEILPAAGSIVASPNFDNPDYYFHWIRDSALVADSLVQLLPHLAGTPSGEKVRAFLGDFVRLSNRLQQSDSIYGLGETRFNADGSIDDTFWARPQHDGAGLRALALLRYYREEKSNLDPELLATLKDTIHRDTNHLSYAFEAQSFDLWEISFGHHFFTGLVQLGALEKARTLVPEFARKEWPKAVKSLKQDLAKHWDSPKGFYHFSLGDVTNSEGEVVPEVGGGLDASVALAVNSAGRREGDLSLRDPKVWASLWKAEEYFRHAFRINEDHPRGPLIGRHPGDDYYGGNPWYVLTAGMAEFYYRLAADVRSHDDDSFFVTALNREPLQSVLGREVKIGADLAATVEGRAELIAKLVAKGDAFLDTIMDILPKDGMMAEQVDKDSGREVSALDLTWSYSAFLTATLAREEAAPSLIAFDKIKLECDK
jgi:glucoamylase